MSSFSISIKLNPICTTNIDANISAVNLIILEFRFVYKSRHAYAPYIQWCDTSHTSWWRHQMETFSALLAICAENSPVPGEFPAQRPVTRNFDVFFDLRLNKRLSKQWWGWWFETLSHPLWRHRNDISPPPLSSTYMCQGTGSALVQIMACRIFGANPLSRPMLGYCQLDQ